MINAPVAFTINVPHGNVPLMYLCVIPDTKYLDKDPNAPPTRSNTNFNITRNFRRIQYFDFYVVIKPVNQESEKFYNFAASFYKNKGKYFKQYFVYNNRYFCTNFYIKLYLQHTHEEIIDNFIWSYHHI